MSSLVERLTWVVIEHRNEDANILAEALIKEILSTHAIIKPDDVTEEMLDACFKALPEHYDPPDPKRRAWHAFKAKRRFTAMVKAARRIL